MKRPVTLSVRIGSLENLANASQYFLVAERPDTASGSMGSELDSGQAESERWIAPTFRG